MQRSNLDPRQAAVLASLCAGEPFAYLVVYEDGTSAAIRDDGRSMRHSTSHAIRVRMAPHPDDLPADLLLERRLDGEAEFESWLSHTAPGVAVD